MMRTIRMMMMMMMTLTREPYEVEHHADEGIGDGQVDRH
jgi:hypothetical protein